MSLSVISTTLVVSAELMKKVLRRKPVRV